MPEPGGSLAGILVPVVGPSGAGKDTLIDVARVALAGRPLLFARRIVTRPSSAAERHDSLDSAAFESASERGAFAFRWRAHGLHYAIPVGIEPALAAGSAVVCNVSRSVIPALRSRYPRVFVIYIDAPLTVRLGRIAGRARPSEAPDRGRRQQDFGPADADLVIDNGGSLVEASGAFTRAIALQLPQQPALSAP